MCLFAFKHERSLPLTLTKAVFLLNSTTHGTLEADRGLWLNSPAHFMSAVLPSRLLETLSTPVINITLYSFKKCVALQHDLNMTTLVNHVWRLAPAVAHVQQLTAPLIWELYWYFTTTLTFGKMSLTEKRKFCKCNTSL